MTTGGGRKLSLEGVGWESKRGSGENPQKVVSVDALDPLHRLCLLAGNGQKSPVCGNLDRQCGHGTTRLRPSQKLLRKDQAAEP